MAEASLRTAMLCAAQRCQRIELLVFPQLSFLAMPEGDHIRTDCSAVAPACSPFDRVLQTALCLPLSRKTPWIGESGVWYVRTLPAGKKAHQWVCGEDEEHSNPTSRRPSAVARPGTGIIIRHGAKRARSDGRTCTRKTSSWGWWRPLAVHARGSFLPVRWRSALLPGSRSEQDRRVNLFLRRR